MTFKVIVLCMLVIVIMNCVTYFGYRRDKREWNNGVAPSGERWRQFGVASDGSRGYTDSIGHYIWISWPVDK